MSEGNALKIGSRESMLAQVQANMVLDYIRMNCPELQVEIVTMKTTGDKILDRRLDQIGGKGLFVKELDQALRDRRTDLSVHSAKDLPMDIPEDLPLVCFSKREDPRDVLILREGETEIDLSKPIGTSSKRREMQLRAMYPGAELQSIRGNLQTRLKKLDEGQYGAIVLAAAGVKRMGLADRISRYFSAEEMIPAAGQGILAVQGRAGEDYGFLSGFANRTGLFEAAAERAFVRALDGGCSSPIAAHASLHSDGDEMTLTGFYADEEETYSCRDSVTGYVKTTADCEALGVLLAEKMRS